MQSLRHHLPILCLLALWAASYIALPAQAVFQKKIDRLYDAYGLATMPDGGYLMGGLWSNCVYLTRFNPLAEPLWTQKICPLNAGVDIHLSYLQLEAYGTEGDFFVQFLKGSFSSSPDNLLDLMRFDADGNLLWESQLKPTLRYGVFASGSQFAALPDGAVWSVQGLGFTPALPDYNQVLVFKTSPLGKVLLRNFYWTDVQATASGVIAESDQGAIVYGRLEDFASGGFLLKLDATGAVQWARRYPDMLFDRDGGRFQNGDLLLYGVTPQGVAFARIRPSDGTVLWARRIGGGLGSDHFEVAADDGIFATVRSPATGPTAFIRLSPDASAVEWANTYETCADYITLDTRATTDGGLAFTQSANDGPPHARFLKINPLGQLLPGCTVRPAPLPPIEPFPVQIASLVFIPQSSSIPESQALFSASPASANVADHCPADLPQAHFSLPDSVCSPAAIQLAADGNQQAFEWRWAMSGATPDTAKGVVVQDVRFPVFGLFSIKLVQRYAMCSDTFVDTLRVLPPLSTELFGFDDTLICRNAALLVVPLSADFDAWLWDDGSTQPSRLLDPVRAGTYRLRAQRGLCAAADSFFIKTLPCGATDFFAPNVFSPNGDAQNDLWEISAQPDIAVLGCAVYDRWGNEVYAAAEGEVPRWDGHFRRKPAPPGVYAWWLKIRDAEGAVRVESGSLTLVR